MAVSVGAVLGAIIFAYIQYGSGKNVPVADDKISGIQKVIYNKYYVDEIYDAVIVKPLYALSTFGHRILDNTIIDGLVNSFGKVVYVSSDYVRRIQTGNTSFYILLMVIGSVVLLAFNLVIK